VLAAALILPGAHSHTVGTTPPNGPGSSGGTKPEQPVAERIRLTPPSDPPAAAFRRLTARLRARLVMLTATLILATAFTLFFGTLSCKPGAINWPQVVACAEPLEPELMKTVAEILASPQDADAALSALVKSGASAEAVVCAVKQLMGDIGLDKVSERDAYMRGRGNAFLLKIGQFSNR
jgi:hypothetical protein